MKYLMCCLLGFSSFAFAQDPHFSQQYATKLRLNPAFTGLTSDINVTAAYRNQWPSLSGAFITNHISGEMRFGESKSSGALLLAHDKAGSSAFTQFDLSGIYGYHTKISKRFAVSAALQATYGSKKVDFSTLTFGDQFTDDGFKDIPSAEINSYEPVKFVSFGTGGILYNDQLWLSISAQHLNQPDLGSTTISRLPLKMTLNGGYKFYAWTYLSQNKLYELSFTPTVTTYFQGPFNKLDLGFYTLYTPVTVGIIGRNIFPSEIFRGNPDLPISHEPTVVLIAGIQLNQFKFAYSYDIGLSGISTGWGGSPRNNIDL